VPFDSAPSAVIHALDLIKQRITEAGIGVNAEFNEVLSAAYMEQQKMAVCRIFALTLIDSACSRRHSSTVMLSEVSDPTLPRYL
jgi:phage terminase large subunit